MLHRGKVLKFHCELSNALRPLLERGGIYRVCAKRHLTENALRMEHVVIKGPHRVPKRHECALSLCASGHNVREELIHVVGGVVPKVRPLGCNVSDNTLRVQRLKPVADQFLGVLTKVERLGLNLPSGVPNPRAQLLLGKSGLFLGRD